MDKKGAEYLLTVVIVFMVLIIAAIGLIYFFLVSHGKLTGVWNLLFKQNANATEVIPVENKNQSDVAKNMEAKESEADELYKKYRDGDNTALEKLENDYPNSVAKKFAEVLNSRDFDKEAADLCSSDKARVVISLVYCGDIYKTKAEKDKSNSPKYNQLSLPFYKKAMGLSWDKMTNDREKRFYVYSYYYAADVAEKVDGNGKSYIDNYNKLRGEVFKGDRSNMQRYLYSEDLSDFEGIIDVVTEEGIVKGYVREIYVDPVLEIEGKPSLSVSDFKRGVGKVIKGGQPIEISFSNTRLDIWNNKYVPITLFVRALPYAELGIFCEFTLVFYGNAQQYFTSFNKALPKGYNNDFCNEIDLEYMLQGEVNNIKYRITWR